MTSALGKLLAITENYPDLKANQNFLELQAQLEGTENRINVARTNFNNAAKNFNTAIRRFPKISLPVSSVLRNELISKRQKERNKLPRYNSDKYTTL